MLKKQSKKTLPAVLVLFLTLFFIATKSLPSTTSLLYGSLLILFVFVSIFFSIKFFFNKETLLLGFSILVLKLPLTLGFIYWAFKQQDFDTLSFLIGMLIVLPCLVILSYRKQ